AKLAINIFGKFRRQCNLCGFHGYFLAFGYPPRFDATCPNCGSLERHRLFGLWLKENQSRISGKDILHFAPEAVLKKCIKPLAAIYQTADLNPEYGDVVLNIEEITLPDESVDVIICGHVLEHLDHKRALSELRRVLRPDGILLLLFPIVEGWDETYENAALTTPEERELHFGQGDHIRFFGRQVRSDIL